MPQPIPTPLQASPAAAWPARARLGQERRQTHRHELYPSAPSEPISIEFAASGVAQGPVIGELLDLSASGYRIETRDATLSPGSDVSVRLRLPTSLGINPFFTAGDRGEPTNEALVKLTVLRRFEREPGVYEIGGTIDGLDENQRGMLRLYLSTQPLAA